MPKVETHDLLFSLSQSRRAAFGFIFIASAIPIGMVLVLNSWKDIPFGNLMRDPTAVSEAPLYTGFFSQLGIFLWAGTAAVCILSAVVLARSRRYDELKWFLLVCALLTLVLGLDDVFLIHEELMPFFGVPEEIVLGSYAVFTVLYLLRFRWEILKTDFTVLGVALAFFGVAVALDLMMLDGIDPYLFEDSAKFIGIVSWMVYFFRVSASAVEPRHLG